MPRKKIIQIILGLALILFLGIGGYFRWMQVELPVLLEEPDDTPHRIIMACKIQRRDLNSLSHKIETNRIIVNQELSTWDPKIKITTPNLLGSAMGTSYRITIVGAVQANDLNELSKRVEIELAKINRQMSTWDPDSEISLFNQSDESGSFPASEGFSTVVQRALELSKTTGGAFDPTLQPLLNLWGFGSEGEVREVPSDADIAKTKSKTGWDKVWIDESGALWKAAPDVELALGAIAKGYGVDAIGQLLDHAGHENWFAEIGGEVVARGSNPADVPWRIGIQYPTSNPMVDKLQGIVNLTEGAVATSGDYRNYIEENGVLYSHILDPRSGRAVLSDTASVTVVAPNCMDADGMATALFVMGATEGLAWVEDRSAVEAMFLVRGADGEISEKISSGFVAATRYISEPSTKN